MADEYKVDIFLPLINCTILPLTVNLKNLATFSPNVIFLFSFWK